MKTILLVLVSLYSFFQNAYAHGGEGHGGWGHHGGGSYYGHHYGGGFYLGTPFYSYPYYNNYPPTIITAPSSPPTVYIQQMPPPIPIVQQNSTPNYWYYCDNPEGYYPYVKQCMNNWLRVVPSPPPPTN